MHHKYKAELDVLHDAENKSIRRIRQDDLKYCFNFWDFENNLDKRMRIASELAENIRVMYAYVLNDKYVAGMSLSPVDDKTIYLSYLVVSEEYRNQGIGTELIRYARHTSKKDGYTYMVLNVDHDNAEAARLYQKLGFAAIGDNSERTQMRIVL